MEYKTTLTNKKSLPLFILRTLEDCLYLKMKGHFGETSTYKHNDTYHHMNSLKNTPEKF